MASLSLAIYSSPPCFLGLYHKGRDSFVNKWEAISIPRGTLQVTFVHKGFDETRRLGLQSETEQLVRHASPEGETGMLVVDFVAPGGLAYKCLAPGDVLVCMNGKSDIRFPRGFHNPQQKLQIHDPCFSLTPWHPHKWSSSPSHSLCSKSSNMFKAFSFLLLFQASVVFTLSEAKLSIIHPEPATKGFNISNVQNAGSCSMGDWS
ncbi:hypothetical protein DVH24_027947 [Malus domestica]|uniref:PDZ domain-containing protein n=1 Tax=Malus domestica TaxID=3750 RepID=A0A498HAE1_MALDO|nr:hypothetical protein DVH24_027947 [Malus domestica]